MPILCGVNELSLLQESVAGHVAVLWTNLTEPEALVAHLARQQQRQHPERFGGKQPYAFCRVRYVPPCERFPELRRLILCVKEVTGLRAEFRGIMAAEVSEWLGREEEEYFTVLLKYLYDHRDIWQGWLVVRNCPERQMARFLSACALYLTPRLSDRRLCRDPERLERLLRARFRQSGREIAPEAARLLTEALLSPRLARARSLTVLDRVAAEIAGGAGPQAVIGEADVGGYLDRADSLLALLGGGPAEERGAPR